MNYNTAKVPPRMDDTPLCTSKNTTVRRPNSPGEGSRDLLSPSLRMMIICPMSFPHGRCHHAAVPCTRWTRSNTASRSSTTCCKRHAAPFVHQHRIFQPAVPFSISRGIHLYFDVAAVAVVHEP